MLQLSLIGTKGQVLKVAQCNLESEAIVIMAETREFCEKNKKACPTFVLVDMQTGKTIRQQ